MNVNIIGQTIQPQEVIAQMPLSAKFREIKAERDRAIQSIITGTSDKFLLIIGPCSAHNEEAVLDYVGRLAQLQAQYHEKLVLLPRVYTNKPRTTGVGYKGLVHQPDPGKEPDLLEGVFAIRRMHLHVLESSGLTTADEMLYPENYPYLADLLSYVAVGARSSENQQHRLVSSGINKPVGIKNPTSGDLNVMMNSIQAAQAGHEFIYNAQVIQSHGNPLAHAILRGAVNKHGQSIPNYHYEDLQLAATFYRERGLANPTIIVDTNHDNSRKQHKEQIRIVKEILTNRMWEDGLRTMIKGLMIESFLVEGRQDIEKSNVYGQSITDPCLGWDQTQRLLEYIANTV